MQTTPTHLSEVNFRRWEPQLIAATQYVDSYKVDLGGLATATVAASLRNAIRSYRIYKWQSPLDTNALDAMMVSVAVDGTIMLTKRSPVAIASVQTTSASLTITVPNNDVLMAVLVLCHYRALDSATLDAVDPAAVRLVAEAYDVEVIDLGAHSVRIV